MGGSMGVGLSVLRKENVREEEALTVQGDAMLLYGYAGLMRCAAGCELVHREDMVED